MVGNVAPCERNDAPQLIVRGVPSSKMRITSLSKLLGVPDRFVVIDVMLAAKAVIVTASQLSVLIVGVAELLIVVTRGVTRLLVSVCVSVVPTNAPVGAAAPEASAFEPSVTTTRLAVSPLMVAPANVGEAVALTL